MARHGLPGSTVVLLPLLLCFGIGLSTISDGREAFSNTFDVVVNCSNFSQEYADEIASYAPLLKNFTDLVLDGAFKGLTYARLAEFVDTFGSRIVGSQNLEDSIDYIIEQLEADGLDIVRTENVTVPVWIRGSESLELIEPRSKPLAILGLGQSVGTPPEGITAEVVVVQSFEELSEKADQVPGKIVVYNQPWVDYDQSVKFRAHGSVEAARLGAVAALVRSVTSRSIYSPHTGLLDYDVNVPKIPGASITVEDAEMFQRFSDRGVNITVKLTMEAHNDPEGISRNLIADYVGRETPLDFVYVSGHIDTWDVGQGGMDDGGGAFISLLTPVVFKELGLVPRRTLRTILWTGEEFAYVGANQYLLDHSGELHHVDVVLESDHGTSDPKGYALSGVHEAACIFQELLKLTAPLNATMLQMPDDGSDETIFAQNGVPAAGLKTWSEDYFDYHHSNGDTMTVEDPDSLDRCLAFYAFTSYVIADLSFNVPHQRCASKNGC